MKLNPGTMSGPQRMIRQASRAAIIAALPLVTVIACSAPPPEALDASARKATAAATGQASPDSIVVSNIQRGAAKTSWRASVGNVSYECDADEKLNLPDCHPAK